MKKNHNKNADEKIAYRRLTTLQLAEKVGSFVSTTIPSKFKSPHNFIEFFFVHSE